MTPQALESALRCGDGRCGTLLAPDAEVCDECGGTFLVSATEGAAVLVGLAAERPVVFGLRGAGQTRVGRGEGTSFAPDIDLSRFPGSDSVHRRHAELAVRDGSWHVTHLGRNPLVIQRANNETVIVEPGSTEALRPGDWLQFGRVRLRLLVPDGLGVQG